MTSQEATMQTSRLERYNQLCGLRDRYNNLLRSITRDDPKGPHEKGPFTGNTRESRRVEALTIEFSPTRGGAPRTGNVVLSGLDLEAHEFGSYLQSHLCKLIKKVNNEIEAL